jgi:hypothetical protein
MLPLRLVKKPANELVSIPIADTPCLLLQILGKTVRDTALLHDPNAWLLNSARHHPGCRGRYWYTTRRLATNTVITGARQNGPEADSDASICFFMRL